MKDFEGYWLFGLSGAGKTTIGDALHHEYQLSTVRLDGDILRANVCKDLGFSPEDRAKNIDRAISIAAWEIDQGRFPIATFITPYESLREQIRKRLPGIGLVWVACPLAVCEGRDVKGLYAKARAGIIPEFTGVSAPFDTPLDFDIALNTDLLTTEACVTELQ